MCSDGILEVIGSHCLKLIEVNIVSSVGCKQAIYNRDVTDAGLRYVANLKKLRKLHMDCPRNERNIKLRNRPGVTESGIMLLVSSLPCLEDLCIAHFDIGTNIINSKVVLGPLNLRVIRYNFPSHDGIRKLLGICPNVRNITVEHMPEIDTTMDMVLKEITNSNATISQLELPFFKFSDSFKQFLKIKGLYITDISLRDSGNALTFEALLCVGTCCVNLVTLFFTSHSPTLEIPKFYQTPPHVFPELKMVTLGNGLFNIRDFLMFLLANRQVRELTVIYPPKDRILKKDIQNEILYLLQIGYLRLMNSIWLDDNLVISKSAVITLIDQCVHLTHLTVNQSKDERRQVYKYIKDNNYEVELG